LGPQIEQARGVSMKEFSNQGNEWGYFLQPLTKIYLHSDLNNELGKTGNINNIFFFSAIALFLILIAAINFMNLSTANILLISTLADKHSSSIYSKKPG
jgi:putative ABC transport system permease protein